MSTHTRSSGGGRNNRKTNSGGATNSNDSSSKKTEFSNKNIDKDKQQSQSIVLVQKNQPTAEEMRIAEITEISRGYKSPQMSNNVATLMELTKRSEEDVCCALNECDYDIQKAAEFLLETLPVGAFELSSKKKKKQSSSAGNTGGGGGSGGGGGNDDSVEDWDNPGGNGNHGGNDRREKSRNRSSTRGGGRGGTDSRGWRGREARENERNVAESNKYGDNRDSAGGGYRGRGRGGYGSRGGYSGGRGGRGGRMGPRGGMGERGPRDPNRNYSSRQPQDQQQHPEVDNWDNAIAQTAEKQQHQQQSQDDAWGDWDNEEYVGSLKDTKVFTPSNLQTTASIVASSSVELSTPPGLDQQQQINVSDDLLQQQYTNSQVSANSVLNPSQFPEIHSSSVTASSAAAAVAAAAAAAAAQQAKASATLSAEQSQYFNSLTSQNAQQQQQALNASTNQNYAAAVQYPSNYGTVFGDPSSVAQPRRARAKVPPPSKIPATAVEMPGDMLNTASYLEDVQFGFGIEDSAFADTLSDKFTSAASIVDNSQQNAVQNQQQQDVSPVNDYQSKQQSLSAGLQGNKIADSLTSGYSQRTTSTVQQQQVSGVGSIVSSANTALDQLTKNDPYGQSNTSNTGSYQSTYNTSAGTNKVPTYQPAGQGYNSNTTYNSNQSSASSYQPQPNNYNAYNQNSVNSYQQQANNSSVVSGSTGNSTQNIPVGVGGGSGSTVNNSSANANSGGYLSSQYQSNQTASAFQSQQNAYQNSQSVYGGSTGLSNNSGVSSVTSNSAVTSTVSSVTSTGSSAANSSLSSPPSAVSAVSSTLGLANTNSKMNSNNNNNIINSNSSNSSTANNSSSAVSVGSSSAVAAAASNNQKNNPSSGVVQPNIQMVSQYIQTAGLPYYQQPVYSYEDITIMQQRMPHVTQYFDMNYTPTSLGTAGVRDANLGSVAYSTMTDGRFTRTDNNSSPVSNQQVSNTMSQQAGSSAPMINVPYAYFYGGNMMPGGFQYHGTPTIYPQQMPTANATSAGQFPKPSYNSGYGSAASYDALTQATQDYTKGAYPGSGVSQPTKSQNVSNPPQAGTGSDITSSMYGKGHVALNKVNSYDKQTFHSATPPPFNLTGTQGTGTGSTQYGMYIQQMPAAAHHNMNMHQPIHQDSNSTGQRQQSSSQSKSGAKQGYSPSYWTGTN